MLKPVPSYDEIQARKPRFIQLRIMKDGWVALNHLSLDQDKSLQELLLEAVNDLFRKYGKSPVARGPVSKHEAA